MLDSKYHTVLSGWKRSVAHMKSQQLWLCAQNLQKIKPVQIPTWTGKEFTEPTPRTIGFEWLLASRDSVIFRDSAPERLPMFQRMSLHLCTWQ